MAFVFCVSVWSGLAEEAVDKDKCKSPLHVSGSMCFGCKDVWVRYSSHLTSEENLIAQVEKKTSPFALMPIFVETPNAFRRPALATPSASVCALVILGTVFAGTRSEWEAF